VTRRPRALLCIAIAFFTLSAGECELGDILPRPGRIVVTNTGTEPAVVAIIAPDVKSYPTLAGGASASVSTNTGGQYEVRVVMTPENTQRYRAELLALRTAVEKLVDGSLTSEEKTRLFITLAGIKAAILALEQANAAGCSGRIELSQDTEGTVNATVQWVPQSGAGFWDTTCGSG
jgi:hypothetical protein